METHSNYAFIDAQNVYRQLQEEGWQIDVFRFYRYLQDKYKVRKAFWFVGYVPHYAPFYQVLRQAGFELVFKEVLYQGKTVLKGNVDVLLTLYVLKLQSEYQQAVLVSGDGDFQPLVSYLIQHCAFRAVIAPRRKTCSYLLRKACGSSHAIDFLTDLRHKIERVP